MFVVIVLRDGEALAAYHGFRSRAHAEDWAAQAVPGYTWQVCISINVDEPG